MNGTIAVVGQMRSGTSMTMQMLAAAGLTAPGDVGFEDTRIFKWIGTPGWWVDYGVVKFVDPHTNLTHFNSGLFPRVIYCQRENIKQQAKSIKKFAQFTGVPSAPIKPIRADIKKAQRWYKTHLKGAEVLHLMFEDSISDPLGTAKLIAHFVGRGDPETIASVVRPRSPDCYPDMLELDLVENESAEAVE